MVKGKIICLCTRSEENLFARKISSLVLLRLQVNYNVEYGDGIKSIGDKIGMPCRHSTAI